MKGNGAPRALLVTRVAAIVVVLGAIVSPPVANLAAALMFGAFFFSCPTGAPRLQAVWASRLGKGVVVFIAALALATLVAAFSPQGLAGALPHLFGWRTLLLLAIAFAVFDSARWKKNLALTFVVFASIAAVVALVCWQIGWQYRPDVDPGIILRNTVTQAMAFGIAAFLAGVLLVTQPALPKQHRVLLGLAVVLLLGQLLFLQVGRSGQVMAGVLVIVAAAMRLRGARRVLAIATVPVVAVLAVNVSPVMHARFEKAWTELGTAANGTEYTSMGIRVVMWQNTAQLIRARPLLGYGLGGMRPAYAAYIKDRASGWQATVTGDPHNQFFRGVGSMRASPVCWHSCCCLPPRRCSPLPTHGERSRSRYLWPGARPAW